jgi:hypothetical protein
MDDVSQVMDKPDQALQILLTMLWQQRALQRLPLPSFDEIQFQAYSQNGEDGILLYVFSQIGTTNKVCVELCAGDGIQCNTANLIVNHGWHGLLFDGEQENIEKGKAFYLQTSTTSLWPPNLQHAWITRDNVNLLIREQRVEGQIDLLSLDMDGNDYWILDALEVVQPRVIILEYQNAWPADVAVTQQYREDFHVSQVQVNGTLPRCGASLAAFTKLAKQKGYRLVGCERNCFNAVFIRDGIGEAEFPAVAVDACLLHPMAEYRRTFLQDHRDELPDMWVEV